MFSVWSIKCKYLLRQCHWDLFSSRKKCSLMNDVYFEYIWRFIIELYTDNDDARHIHDIDRALFLWCFRSVLWLQAWLSNLNHTFRFTYIWVPKVIKQTVQDQVDYREKYFSVNGMDVGPGGGSNSPWWSVGCEMDKGAHQLFKNSSPKSWSSEIL